jgi:hypothetical protein
MTRFQRLRGRAIVAAIAVAGLDAVMVSEGPDGKACVANEAGGAGRQADGAPSQSAAVRR